MCADAPYLADHIEASDRISSDALEQHAATVEALADLGMHQPLYVFTSTFFEEATREVLHQEEDEPYINLNSCSAEYASQLETVAEEGYIDDATYEVMDGIRYTRNHVLNDDEDLDQEELNDGLELYEQTLDELGIDVDTTVSDVNRDDPDERVETLQANDLHAAAVVELYDRELEQAVEDAEEKGYDVAHERASFTGGTTAIEDLALEKEMEYLKKQFGHTLSAFEPDRYRRLVDGPLVDTFVHTLD